MSFERALLTLGAAAGLALFAAACATPEPKTELIDPGMGEAVAWNKDIQAINPDPVYPADAAQPGSNGEVAAGATERYRKGQVKALDRVETTGGSSSGGGSGPQ